MYDDFVQQGNSDFVVKQGEGPDDEYQDLQFEIVAIATKLGSLTHL